VITVVLPTYDEREGIAAVVADVLAVVRRAHLDAEVLVVDDDSPDGTAAHLAEVFRGDPAVRIAVRRGERGLASAIYHGLQAARGEVLAVMDADGNHDPEILPRMVRCAEDFDVVVGSRFVPGGGMRTSALRYWASYGFNLFIRAVLGQPVHDNLSGYLVFRREVLARLDAPAIFYGYGDYAIRFLRGVLRGGGRVLEIPTVYQHRKGGASKTRFLAHFSTYVGSVLRLRFAGR